MKLCECLCRLLWLCVTGDRGQISDTPCELNNGGEHLRRQGVWVERSVVGHGTTEKPWNGRTAELKSVEAQDELEISNGSNHAVS